MKYIFTLLFIFSSFFSFGQFSFDDLLGIYKMDFDQFETYSLKNGYSFDDSDSAYGALMVIYSKVEDGKIRKISLVKLSASEEGSIAVSYVTSISTDLLKLKDDLERNGFKFLKTRKQEQSIIKTYSNKILDINIASEKSIEFNSDIHRIILSKHLNE